MDDSRFDAWTRRRLGLRAGGALAALLGLVGRPASDVAIARQRRKRHVKRNAFGCVNVGGKCRGRDKNCCSSICRGKKPKKGEKDTSRCVAHDAQGCVAGQIEDFCGGTNVSCTTSTGTPGRCNTTTGNAGYCAGDGSCAVGSCKKDADCVPAFGVGAACVVCDNALCSGGAGCASLDVL